MFSTEFDTMWSLIVVGVIITAVAGLAFAYVKGSKMVAADDRAFAAGPAAMVTILSCRSSTGMVEGASDVTIWCDLEVAVQGDTGYRNVGASTWNLSDCAVSVPLHHAGSFRPGLKLPAKVHSADPGQLRFLWEDLARMPS